LNNSGNQIRNKKIREYPKTDREKLARLEILMHKEFPEITVMIEPFMLFTKGEEAYRGFRSTLDQETVEKYLVHPPDLLLLKKNTPIAFELDGRIHDMKTQKTYERNERYKRNNITFFVINEADLKFKLKMPKTRPLTQEQINNEFRKKLKDLIK